MILSIDQRSEAPLYLQIRDQVIEAIARGELAPGDALPSVRSLASDLGINLHTVNKAYAVLRDEGYVLMRGRSGAYIADPCDEDRADAAQAALARMEDDLFELAFLECAAAQATRAYDILDRPEAVRTASTRKAAKKNLHSTREEGGSLLRGGASLSSATTSATGAAKA